MIITGAVEILEDSRFSSTGMVKVRARRESDVGHLDYVVQVYGPFDEIKRFRLGQKVTIEIGSAE